MKIFVSIWLGSYCLIFVKFTKITMKLKNVYLYGFMSCRLEIRDITAH
jgi:hypothetical protein